MLEVTALLQISHRLC